MSEENSVSINKKGSLKVTGKYTLTYTNDAGEEVTEVIDGKRSFCRYLRSCRRAAHAECKWIFDRLSPRIS